ncbi:galactose-1-phosphate uridylyltransferase [bacterium]|nr:galactose-1-phosphate uridylyltransferase [bacterium]
MTEFRRDPIIGRWVIIAEERGKRPSDFTDEEYSVQRGFCPFCQGNEGWTPPEILAVRASKTGANRPGWQLRVVPNKYPALVTQGDLDRREFGLYEKMSGIGAHEVIIETPDHTVSLADLPLDHFCIVIESFKARLLALSKDARFELAIIFKNHGRPAGASLEHSHSQLIALPIIPKRVSEELQGALNYFLAKNQCIYCEIIRTELERCERVIDVSEHFILLAPYASRFPFEMWLLPREHSSHFERTSPDMLNHLADFMKKALLRMNQALASPPYNFLLHTSPFSDKSARYYHWHFEIIPKLSRIAGFEWGTGFYINPTSPEQATRFLKGSE